MSNPLDNLAIQTIRGLSMDAVQKANSGHPGTPMALAPLGWALFDKVRRHDPSRPEWANRDRFVLSCGHASMLQYSLLHLAGYGLTLDDIKEFRQWGSKTPGHPEYGHTDGVEITTGPLGQGFATAVGMAMAERHLAERFNREGHEIIGHHTWVIASDGDIMEGVASEAASLAGHLSLGKLIVFWDDNRITIDGSLDLSFSEDVLARFASYGWHTCSVEDGNDIDAIVAASEEAKNDPRPTFVRVRTVIGYPSPNKQDTASAHGAPLGADEITLTKAAMKWSDEPFYVPSELSSATDAIVQRGRDFSSEWDRQLEAYTQQYPDAAKALAQVLSGELSPGWEDSLPVFEASEKGIATRGASGKIVAALTESLPELVGGSADLTGSNKTKLPGVSDFRVESSESLPSRNVFWGIREHAMAAAVNGMALHGGVVPFGATFLVFSDYMRPSLRLGSLMGVKSRFVFSHDSIGLGEDGPTHQPIEHLAVLRAIPGFAVLRPGDANETRECWKAMLRYEGPAAIVLTRQNVPTVDRSVLSPAEGALRGGYVLREANGGTPEVILIATGSEVSIALEAADALEAKGRRVRVVSMPCTEIFDAQQSEYREEVLPRAVQARVVVEAGSRFGWERYAGADGAFVTVDGFGASAPYEVLYEKYGITADGVVSAAESLL